MNNVMENANNICFSYRHTAVRHLSKILNKMQMLTRDCKRKTVLRLRISSSAQKAFRDLSQTLEQVAPDIEKRLTKVPPKTMVPIPMLGVDVDLENIHTIDELYSALETPLE